MSIPPILRSNLAVLWVLLFVLMVFYFNGTGERTPTLTPALPINRQADRQIADELTRAEEYAAKKHPLPAFPSLNFRVNEDRPGPGKVITGTAFAISADRETGYWVTNHHVVENCRQDLRLTVRSRSPVATTIRFDQANDVALVKTQRAVDERLTASTRLPHLGEEGYVYGYPAGRPGVISGRLLGRARMIYSRRNGELLYWVETARSASNMTGGLGGASGSPVVNAAGEVVGVLAVSESRRGRFGSVTLEALRSIIPNSGTAAAVTVSLQSQTWEERGVELMRRGLVVKTQCAS